MLNYYKQNYPDLWNSDNRAASLGALRPAGCRGIGDDHHALVVERENIASGLK